MTMDEAKAEVIAAAVAYEAASVELCAAIEAQFAPKGDVLELFDARTRRALPASKPYPRVAVPVCSAVTARCA